MAKRAAIKTRTKDIVEYWESRVDESDLGCDFSEADKLCWRCGYERKLYRCHIVSAHLGGADDPSNLVLLCGQCHDESPMVGDSSVMWDWIRRTRVPCYGTYWIVHAMEIYQKRYGVLTIEMMSLFLSNKRKYLDFAFQYAGSHYGIGFSIETKVEVFRLMFDMVRTDLNGATDGR